MYKLSPSLLDVFLQVQGKSKWEKTPEELVEYITKKDFEPTPAMQLGTDIHKFIDEGTSDVLLPSEQNQLFKMHDYFISATKELKIRVNLTDDIVISCIADAVLGNIIHEFKIGSRFYGVDNYYGSTQWKIYSLVYDAPQVVYTHILYGSKRPYKFNFTQFSFFPYEGMREEIIQLAYEFIAFCKIRGIGEYIKLK